MVITSSTPVKRHLHLTFNSSISNTLASAQVVLAVQGVCVHDGDRGGMIQFRVSRQNGTIGAVFIQWIMTVVLEISLMMEWGDPIWTYVLTLLGLSVMAEHPSSPLLVGSQLWVT